MTDDGDRDGGGYSTVLSFTGCRLFLSDGGVTLPRMLLRLSKVSSCHVGNALKGCAFSPFTDNTGYGRVRSELYLLFSGDGPEGHKELAIGHFFASFSRGYGARRVFTTENSARGVDETAGNSAIERDDDEWGAGYGMRLRYAGHGLVGHDVRGSVG